VSQLLEVAGVQNIVGNYLATVHEWLPVIQPRKLDQAISLPIWESGAELSALLLAMKLVTSHSCDSSDIDQHHIYQTTKRFIGLLEAGGAVSLTVLQANLLVAWHEYGQAIYPASYITTGWCVRYANLLGINGYPGAIQLLPGQVGKSLTIVAETD